MPYHNPNSRSRRNVLRIVGALVVLAVIASVANFLHTTTSEAASNVKPQIETMQGIRQTAQDSITFAQGLDDPDRFAAHIETVQQCMDDYDRLADTKQIKYLLSDNPQERIIGLLYRNQQRTIIDNMRVSAHNLDKQTKELLSAADIHHIGDTGVPGMALPQNIMAYSIAIRGERHTYHKMAQSVNR